MPALTASRDPGTPAAFPPEIPQVAPEPGRVISLPVVTRHQCTDSFDAGAGTGAAGGAYHCEGGTTLAPAGSAM